MKKLILTDIDGVCLNWEKGFRLYVDIEYDMKPTIEPFHHWNIEQCYSNMTKVQCIEYIKEFNSSWCMAYLEAIPGAPSNLLRLKDQGFDIYGLTSFSKNDSDIIKRKHNINTLFPGIFNDVTCLSLGQSKKQVLADFINRYDTAFWIEDNIQNLQDGVDLGYHGILFRQEYNKSYDGPVFTAHNWQDIYKHIINL